jgi:ectoine hydroxylase-related dioxygenase (phytanoyl-CoA dioxygenase family)
MNDSGFWIEENVFSSSECDRLLELLSNLSLERSRAGARHLMTEPALQSFALDSRLLHIAARAFDQPLVPYKATLFDKSDHANWLVPWHQDTTLPLAQKFSQTGWGAWSRKAGIDYAQAPAWVLARILTLRIHLDASTPINGGLKVIPGSHLSGVLSDQAIAAIAQASQHVDCAIGRGGVLAISPLLLHSSSKSETRQPRRVLHIEYTHQLEIAPNIRLKLA